jgi:Family of unknown function (DUF5999)
VVTATREPLLTAEAAPRVWADVFAKPPTTRTTVKGCTHIPACPTADQPNHDAAVEVACHHEQGWVRLCNGVILFDDRGELAPDRTPTPAHQGPAPHCTETGHGHACPCDPEEN